MISNPQPRTRGLSEKIQVLDGKTSISAWLIALCGFCPLGALSLFAEGIPEPSIVMYGVVDGVFGADRIRQTSGNLVWVFRSSVDGREITYSNTLADINGQYSYLLQLPCETEIVGQLLSSKALRISPGSTTYNRAMVTLDGASLQVRRMEQESMIVSTADRGRLERVDLKMSLGTPVDSDGDRIADDWEQQLVDVDTEDAMMSISDVHSEDDFDGDGSSNREEYLAGTNPSDLNSFLVAVDSAADPVAGDLCLRWASVSNRSYSIHRSTDLLTWMDDYATGITGTPPVNEYCDRELDVNKETYFYRVVVE